MIAKYLSEVSQSYIREMKWFLVNSSINRQHFIKTRKLRNTKRYTDLFLFANGPSLTKLDARKIRWYQKSGFEVFCINSYINSELATTVPPDYYHIADPAHFLDFSAQEISSIYIEKARSDNKKISGLKCPLFIPINRVGCFPAANTFPIAHISNPFRTGIGSLFSATGHSTMTAYTALHIAVYMGFRTIYICGIDNSWFKTLAVDELNNLFFDHNHFYDIRHDGNKRLPVTKADGSTVGHYLEIQSRLFNDLYRFSGSNIVNLDPTSLVDAFSKTHSLDVYL